MNMVDVVEEHYTPCRDCAFVTNKDRYLCRWVYVRHTQEPLEADVVTVTGLTDHELTAREYEKLAVLAMVEDGPTNAIYGVGWRDTKRTTRRTFDGWQLVHLWLGKEG